MEKEVPAKQISREERRKGVGVRVNGYREEINFHPTAA